MSLLRGSSTRWCLCYVGTAPLVLAEVARDIARRVTGRRRSILRVSEVARPAVCASGRQADGQGRVAKNETK